MHATLRHDSWKHEKAGGPARACGAFAADEGRHAEGTGALVAGAMVRALRESLWEPVVAGGAAAAA